MKRAFGCALACTAMVAATGALAACGTSKLELSDGFDSLNNKYWGDADQYMSVKNGQMNITQGNGDWYTALADDYFRDIDYCVDVTLTASPDLATTYGGIMFWARTGDDFYTLQIRPDGYADVYHYDGQWESIVDDRAFDAVKKGAKAVNTLRVVTHLGTATFYVNGAKFDMITEDHPPGTSKIGVMVDSPSKGSATFTFDNLEVHDQPL